MKIELKAFYTKTIKVEIEPRVFDIEYGFLTERTVEHLKIPCTFLSGYEFKLSYSCLSCESEIVLTQEIITSQIGELNLGKLCARESGKLSFLNSIYNLFPNIKKKYLNSTWFLIADYNVSSVFRLFHVKCPHCQAKYLGIYIYRTAEIPERPGEIPVPAKVYLDNIAWVEFDEDEFFKEAGIR